MNLNDNGALWDLRADKSAASWVLKSMSCFMCIQQTQFWVSFLCLCLDETYSVHCVCLYSIQNVMLGWTHTCWPTGGHRQKQSLTSGWKALLLLRYTSEAKWSPDQQTDRRVDGQTDRLFFKRKRPFFFKKYRSQTKPLVSHSWEWRTLTGQEKVFTL